MDSILTTDVQACLDAGFRLACWTGFRFDSPQWIATFTQEVASFTPAVCYFDVLRKLTAKDLNKADQAGAILDTLDAIRRAHGVVHRILHHYRKGQGFGRSGRGSQEMGGSYVLGAWAEQSLYFEPIGRKGEGTTVDVQSKDGPPVPRFRLRIEAEGPAHAPTLVRIHAEDMTMAGTADAANDDAVYQAVATLPPVAAKDGAPGVPREAIERAVRKSSATVRRSLDRLLDAGRILLTGTLSRKKKPYGTSENKIKDIHPAQGLFEQGGEQ